MSKIFICDILVKTTHIVKVSYIVVKTAALWDNNNLCSIAVHVNILKENNHHVYPTIYCITEFLLACCQTL